MRQLTFNPKVEQKPALGFANNRRELPELPARWESRSDRTFHISPPVSPNVRSQFRPINAHCDRFLRMGNTLRTAIKRVVNPDLLLSSMELGKKTGGSPRLTATSLDNRGNLPLGLPTSVIVWLTSSFGSRKLSTNSGIATTTSTHFSADNVAVS